MIILARILNEEGDIFYYLICQRFNGSQNVCECCIHSRQTLMNYVIMHCNGKDPHLNTENNLLSASK